ncbi:MerR family transcriptional regulator [Georgenia deserti]|uniref:MerR family transcriptional regulator n=1 Tax=Georgenia deserti TaxID=2093781 RepID=A0ABW4LA40_9MICO
MRERMQIGEVAERTGLSLRTIRYYGEVGLVTPSSRTEGGFRLFTERDVERLELVKQMKPLDFTVEEMREVLSVLDRLAAADLSDDERHELLEALARVRTTADERRTKLRAKVRAAESFVARLDAAVS